MNEHQSINLMWIRCGSLCIQDVTCGGRHVRRAQACLAHMGRREKRVMLRQKWVFVQPVSLRRCSVLLSAGMTWGRGLPLSRAALCAIRFLNRIYYYLLD